MTEVLLWSAQVAVIAAVVHSQWRVMRERRHVRRCVERQLLDGEVIIDLYFVPGTSELVSVTVTRPDGNRPSGAVTTRRENP